MTKEPSTWSSFSGSLTKLIPDRISIPSIKGLRYYGPSKMSFFKLLIHSFSIIAVFKRTTVFLRSFIFLSVYLLLIFQSLSFITLLPVFLIIILLFAVVWLSNRENLDQFKNLWIIFQVLIILTNLYNWQAIKISCINFRKYFLFVFHFFLIWQQPNLM